mmetsp:Transcript_29498/g.84828  ORF Transcript_29498/g.84828 Transcript_29498/m.84828 type:complete len:203 (-) Transcript_29498:1138-1746(-)
MHIVATLHRARREGSARVPRLRYGAPDRCLVLGAECADGELAHGAGRSPKAPCHGPVGPERRRRRGHRAPGLRGRLCAAPHPGRRQGLGRGAQQRPVLRHSGHQNRAGAQVPHPHPRLLLGSLASRAVRRDVRGPMGSVARAALPDGEGCEAGRRGPDLGPGRSGHKGHPRDPLRHRQLLDGQGVAELDERAEVLGLLAPAP